MKRQGATLSVPSSMLLLFRPKNSALFLNQAATSFTPSMLEVGLSMSVIG